MSVEDARSTVAYLRKKTVFTPQQVTDLTMALFVIQNDAIVALADRVRELEKKVN